MSNRAGARRSRRLLIVSYSPIARDPRVGRECRLAEEAGWDYAVVGYGSPSGALPEQFLALVAPLPGARHKMSLVLRQGPALLSRRTAVPAFWRSEEAQRSLVFARKFNPDFVHANDWSALPVAASLGVPFLYDSHEFASGEHDEWLLWRLFFKPYVSAIEGAFIGKAAQVITVSDGIGERLRTMYGLAQRPITIRNMPGYQECPFRPTGDEIEVLYHGAYSPNRGLEELIESVAAWPAGFHLVLRGLGSPSYVDVLKQKASRSSAQARIRFVNPVSTDQLVAAATSSDIGIFTIPPDTVQSAYTLPNKFFEYAMAGLCLVVSPAKEMAREVEARGLGVVTVGTTPADIAAAVSSLTRERIDAAKRASLEAAKELNWDREKQRLLDVWGSLV